MSYSDKDSDKNDPGPTGATAEEVGELEEVHQLSNQLSDEVHAPRTLQTYSYKWGTYKDFCEDRNALALPSPPKVVSAYLLHRSKTLTTQTVQGDRLAIGWKHRSAGHEDPTNSHLVSRAMQVVHQRADPNEGNGQMHALLTADIRDMVDSLSLEAPSDEDGVWEKAMYLRALRDRSLILLGYGAALRASELAGVRVEDFDFNERGMEVHIPDSKTTPRTVGVSFASDARYCPVRSLKEWRSSVGITAGPIYRRVHNSAEIVDYEIDRRTVWRVVKGTAKDIGLDHADRVGAHSLRRGHATQAALSGVSLERLRRQLGHQDPATTARYIQDARRMKEETSQELGL